MQRFVALSSSYHHSLTLPSSFPTSVHPWTSTLDGYTPSIRSVSNNNNNNKGNNGNVRRLILPTEKLSMFCCRCNLGRGYGKEQRQADSRKIFGFQNFVSRRGTDDTRSQFAVSRGKGIGGPEPDKHSLGSHHRHRGQQKSFPQVVDSIRDYASYSWWTHDEGDDYDDSEFSNNDGGSSESGLSSELWTSRILLQLSLFWNLLGYPPSRVDEWLVSHEARRRLNSMNKNNSRFSPNFPVPSSALLSLSPNLHRFFSLGFAQFAAIATPQIRPRERFSWLMDGIQGLAISKWLSRMTDTYGKSFMMLVVLGYATQGFRCFPWFAVGYMLKDGLQVDPAYMQFLLSSAALPMVAKPIYGVISDTVYIRGAHRVPYLAIAGVVQVISWGALALSQTATSSAIILTAALTFGNFGAAIADVMNDALVAEVSKKKKGSGELQSFAWLIMASGGLLGNLFGGFALNRVSLTTMYLIFLILLGLHLLTCLLVSERHFNLAPPVVRATVIKSEDDVVENKAIAVIDVHKWRKKTKQIAAKTGAMVKIQAESVADKLPGLYDQLVGQVQLLSQLLKKKEICRTLMWFCASYAMVPVLGSSIFFYQTQVLHIDPTFIGFSRMLGQVALMVGSQLYGGVLKGLPLRKLLGSVQLLLSLCMLSDLVLVKRINLQLGIPDEFYVLGASALVDCIAQFKVLPVIVRLAQLCPPGSEGSLMAFFSSCHCLAGLFSGYMGVALASSLHISAHSFEGLPVGILIQAMCALLPVLCIKLIPGEVPAAKAVKVAEKVA